MTLGGLDLNLRVPYVKDPIFTKKCYLMVESNAQTYEYALDDPI